MIAMKSESGKREKEIKERKHKRKEDKRRKK